jgi:hypothetical protein
VDSTLAISDGGAHSEIASAMVSQGIIHKFREISRVGPLNFGVAMGPDGLQLVLSPDRTAIEQCAGEQIPK